LSSLNLKNVALISLIAVVALGIGASIGINLSSVRTTTQIQTVTDTSNVVVVQQVTTTSTATRPFPPFVTITGILTTEYYLPLSVDFRICYYGNLSGILGSGFCNSVDYPVQVSDLKNWNETGDLHITTTTQYFNGTYSVRVPNNATYDIYLELRVPGQSNSTSDFATDAIRLPVFSASTNISNYQIGCGFFGPEDINYYVCVD
jgi:uncharacterized membrane protein (UPF0136 family)